MVKRIWEISIIFSGTESVWCFVPKATGTGDRNELKSPRGPKPFFCEWRLAFAEMPVLSSQLWSLFKVSSACKNLRKEQANQTISFIDFDRTNLKNSRALEFATFVVRTDPFLFGCRRTKMSFASEMLPADFNVHGLFAWNVTLETCSKLSASSWYRFLLFSFFACT